MLKPRIVQAADAVAYLPLYLAEEVEGELVRDAGNPLLDLKWKDAFDDPYRTPPVEYLDHLPKGPEREGDRGCLNAIVRAWDQDTLPLIGFCDPCDVASFSELVLVGGLINRASFWCLTNPRVQAKRIEDLDLTHIFIHERGFETGYNIGDDILARIKDGGKAIPQHVYGSFDLLVDGAVWLNENETDVRLAAVSASILSCVIAEQRGLKIALSLHGLPEYNEFLTTGIVVHKRALPLIQDQLTLLVLALRYAIEQIRIDRRRHSRDIARLCNEANRFEAERMIDCAMVELPTITRITAECSGGPTTIDSDQASMIATHLRNLYSRDCDISDKAWENAWRIRRFTGAMPALRDNFDRRVLARAGVMSLRGKDSPKSLSGRALIILSSWILITTILIAIVFSDIVLIAYLITLIAAFIARELPSRLLKGRKLFAVTVIIIWMCSIAIAVFVASLNAADGLLALGLEKPAPVSPPTWWSDFVSVPLSRIIDRWESITFVCTQIFAFLTLVIFTTPSLKSFLPRWIQQLLPGRK